LDKQVTHIIKLTDIGASCPILCLLSDQTTAVVKYPYNQMSNQTIINEWVSYSIALQLELPVPDFGTCILDETAVMEDTFQDYLLAGTFEFSSHNYGTCFFSKYITDATLPEFEIVEKMTNLECFWKCVLFDHIIFNVDRHKKNVLCTLNKSPKFYLIDHGNILKTDRF
jgi:hypothetical protein